MAPKFSKVKQVAIALNLVSLKTGKPFQIVPVQSPGQSELLAKVFKTNEVKAIRKLNAVTKRILLPKRSY